MKTVLMYLPECKWVKSVCINEVRYVNAFGETRREVCGKDKKEGTESWAHRKAWGEQLADQAGSEKALEGQVRYDNRNRHRNRSRSVVEVGTDCPRIGVGNIRTIDKADGAGKAATKDSEGGLP